MMRVREILVRTKIDEERNHRQHCGKLIHSFFPASLGGPLIIRDVNGKKSESTSTSDTLSNHVDALIGIVSWGSQCGLANYPG